MFFTNFAPTTLCLTHKTSEGQSPASPQETEKWSLPAA